MVDSTHRRAILRRRMAFLSGALAVVTGCDKNGPPPPKPDVVVGDPEETSGLPTAAPSAPDPAPATKKMPPPPSTAIPETTCEEDRAVLAKLKESFDSIYAELAQIYEALPSQCEVTDDSCAPKHQPLAKRFAAVREKTWDLMGHCSCPAPIVSEYASKHRGEANGRMTLVRDRIVEIAGNADEAGNKWDQLVRKEATPRPCLSCVRCEPKSACDP